MDSEEHNIKEEIKEIVSNAVKSGISNEGCAVFRVIRTELYSPLGQAIILENGFYDKIIYKCNLCKACDFNSNLCNAFQKAREILVLQKNELPENKEMIKNLEKTGNIYGVKES